MTVPVSASFGTGQNPAYRGCRITIMGGGNAPHSACVVLPSVPSTFSLKRLELFFGILRIPIDALCVALSLLAAYFLRQQNVDLLPGIQLLEPSQSLPSLAFYARSFVIPCMLFFFVSAAVLRLYAFRGTVSAWREIGMILSAVGLWFALVMAWFLFLRQELFFSRILLLHSTFFIFVFVVLERSALTFVYRTLLLGGYGVRSVVTIGHAPSAAVTQTLSSDISYQYLGHASTLDQFHTLLWSQAIDLVLETDPHPQNEQTLTLIDECRSQHIAYAFLPPVFADSPHLLRVEHLGLLPLIRFQPTPLDGWGMLCKTAFDVSAALLLLIVLFPFLLLLAILVLLDSGWPIFYVSRRIGQHGKRMIPLLKFRSMVQDADQKKQQLLAKNHRSDGPLFKLKHDPRVTRVGRFLRLWSLDELPSLFNVVCGHLSLVGPRPHLPEEVSLYKPRQRRVFAVKPGATGMAQVSGRSDLSFEEEVRLDLQYIEEWSFALDFWILWRTIVIVLQRRGAD